MITYTPCKPISQDALPEVMKRVSDSVVKRRIPVPQDVIELYGTEGVKHFYFMYGLFFYVEHGRNRGIFEPARRNQEDLHAHSVDSSIFPDYRHNDPRIPSGFYQTERERRGHLVHDTGEDFGQTPLGSLVVINSIVYLLDALAAYDCDLLTDKNALWLDYAGVKDLPATQINPKGIHKVLEQKMDSIYVTSEDLSREFRRVNRTLSHLGRHVKDKVDYMDDKQKKDTLGIIRGMTEGLAGRIRSRDLPNPNGLTDLIREHYAHILSVMDDAAVHGYIEVDSTLLQPEHPKFLLTLKKTLYQDYASQIRNAVLVNAVAAKQNGTLNNDGYLSPMIEKLVDTTDNVSEMDEIPSHATSIFRKARILIRTGINLTRALQELDMPNYERLPKAVDFLVRYLRATVDERYETFERRAKVQTRYESVADIFQRMQKKMPDLESKVAEMIGVR